MIKWPTGNRICTWNWEGHILWWLLPFLLLQWSGAVCLIVVLAHSIFRLPGLGLHINKHMALLWHLGLHGLCQQDWAWRCETTPESKHLASYQQGKVLYHRVTPFSLRRHLPLQVRNWNVGTSIDSKKYQNLDYKRWLWVKSSYGKRSWMSWMVAGLSPMAVSENSLEVEGF